MSSVKRIRDGNGPKHEQRAPLASTYAQYREWKRVIRDHAACQLQALFRGHRCRGRAGAGAGAGVGSLANGGPEPSSSQKKKRQLAWGAPEQQRRRHQQQDLPGQRLFALSGGGEGEHELEQEAEGADDAAAAADYSAAAATLSAAAAAATGGGVPPTMTMTMASTGASNGSNGSNGSGGSGGGVAAPLEMSMSVPSPAGNHKSSGGSSGSAGSGGGNRQRQNSPSASHSAGSSSGGTMAEQIAVLNRITDMTTLQAEKKRCVVRRFHFIVCVYSLIHNSHSSSTSSSSASLRGVLLGLNGCRVKQRLKSFDQKFLAQHRRMPTKAEKEPIRAL